MIQAKFSLTDAHIQFLAKRDQYGFKDKSEVVRTALDHLQEELIQQRLADAADIYAEIYSDDSETQGWTEAALSHWPE
jgi:Arc/MetJ-type ribon-helix-helix transcriptional regulator